MTADRSFLRLDMFAGVNNLSSNILFWFDILKYGFFLLLDTLDLNIYYN